MHERSKVIFLQNIAQALLNLEQPAAIGLVLLYLKKSLKLSIALEGKICWNNHKDFTILQSEWRLFI